MADARELLRCGRAPRRAGAAHAQTPDRGSVRGRERFVPEVLAKIHRETVRTLNDPKVKENLVNRGMEAVGSTPEAFDAFLKQESEAIGNER